MICPRGGVRAQKFVDGITKRCEDEAGTLAQLKTLRIEVFDPRIAEHNGRIVMTTGDGVLVEFASAVDAAQHAVDVQQALARLSVLDNRVCSKPK